MTFKLEKDPTQWFPMPAALVTSRDKSGRANLMGIGYVGFTCWQPPIVYLGMNTARHSGAVIKDSGEFVLAVPDTDHVYNMDYCGFVSGVDTDKFASSGLTPADGNHVRTPLIVECPLNLECVLKHVLPLGSHDLLLGEVVETHLHDEYASGNKAVDPVILVSRRYMAASEFICDFGASQGCPPETR